MKLSEVKELFDDYAEALWSPSRMSVHLGCECGCGGDGYTIESWDREEENAEKAINAMKEFCAEYNIEYDGVDDGI